MAGVEHVTIDPDLGGQRIDNFLLRTLKGVPKSLVYRLLRRGEVRVNGGRIRPGYRLKGGDDVRLPPVRRGKAVDAKPSDRVLQRLTAAILHESDDLIVLNKPTGLAVHGGSGLAYGIVEALRVLRPETRFLDLAHRLDRDTSGCLIVCKKRGVLADVHEQFRRGEVDKRYLVLLGGPLPRGPVPVEAPLARRTDLHGESVIKIAADGKTARTVFRVIERYGNWTLAEAELATGRMHQIRAHAAHKGWSVVGDRRYGDVEVNRHARHSLRLRRLFLHAAKLSFRLANGTILTVEAPLPDDLAHTLENLRNG